MGHDQHQQSSSSGVLVAVVVVFLLIAMLGLLAIVGVGLFWVRASTGQSQVILAGPQAPVQVRLAETLTDQRTIHIKPERDPRLSYELSIDRDGNATVGGERIGLDELRAQLAKRQEETANVFSVRVNVDPECPARHIVPVLDVCEEIGDIDYRVSVLASPEGSAEKPSAEN